MPRRKSPWPRSTQPSPRNREGQGRTYEKTRPKAGFLIRYPLSSMNTTASIASPEFERSAIEFSNASVLAGRPQIPVSTVFRCPVAEIIASAALTPLAAAESVDGKPI